MTKQQVANGMLKDFPWDGTELTAPLTLPGALLAPSYVEQKLIATPANPPAGSLRLYPKPDGKYYQLDSSGNEQIISGQTQAQNDARYLPLTGGTLTGPLTVQGGVTAQNVTASGNVTTSGVVADTYRWTPASDGESLYKEMPGRLRLSGAQLTIDQNLNVGTYTQFAEVASPVTPNVGFLRLYGKADHKLYMKDNSGAETPLLTQAVGDTRYDVYGAASSGDTAHVGNTDPHPQYLTTAEGDARYAVISGGPGGTYLTDVQADLAYVRQDGTKAMSGPLTVNNTIHATSAVHFDSSMYVGTTSLFAGQVTMSVAPLIVAGIGPNTPTDDLTFQTQSQPRWRISATSGAFLASNDNTYDIGATGGRPRNLLLAGAATVGGSLTSGGAITATSNVSAGGGLWIDTGGTWDGPSVGMTTPALYFGGPPAGTGEGIGSKRTAGGNQYGLEFFCGWVSRMSLSTSGLSIPGSLTVSSGQTTYGHTMMSMATGGIAATAGSEGQLELQNANSGASKICFHRTGSYATYFGLDTDNVFRIGGWSAGGVAYRLLLGDGYPGANNGTVNFGTVNCGQINPSYVNTEGVDIGAGPLYFKHNASYYIQFDGSSMFQAVNMNVMSWGSYYFSANAGIYIGSWDGTWIHTSHNIMMNGASLGFSNNGGVYWNFDGSWMRAYGVTGVGTSGSYYWMANNSGVGMYWDGTYNHIQPNCMSGGAVYFAGNGGIWLTWDGTINASHTLKAPDFTARAGDNAYRHGDDNVRMTRPSGTNIWYCYAYDAQWAFIRTTDGHNCGYVDAGGFHNTSSIKVKQDIAPLRDGLSIVNDKRATPIRFAYRGDEVHDPTPSLGFTAEEMAEVVPEAVGYDKEGPASINYSNLIPVLWDAVRTLSNRVEELEGKLVCQ